MTFWARSRSSGLSDASHCSRSPELGRRPSAIQGGSGKPANGPLVASFGGLAAGASGAGRGVGQAAHRTPSGGRNRRAALGTRRAFFRSAMTMLALAVMPGRSFSSALSTPTMVV